MRTFAPLADGDLPVPGELLDALVDALGVPGRWVLIGATARDLALNLGGVSLPRRATNDVDIAIAAQDALDFDTTLATLGEPTRAWQRRQLLGQQVDAVPLGGLEREGEVVIHESSLTVIGCAEAAANADLVPAAPTLSHRRRPPRGAPATPAWTPPAASTSPSSRNSTHPPKAANDPTRKPILHRLACTGVPRTHELVLSHTRSPRQGLCPSGRVAIREVRSCGWTLERLATRAQGVRRSAWVGWQESARRRPRSGRGSRPGSP